jgi:hypothetical protein
VRAIRADAATRVLESGEKGVASRTTFMLDARCRLAWNAMTSGALVYRKAAHASGSGGFDVMR